MSEKPTCVKLTFIADYLMIAGDTATQVQVSQVFV